MAAVTRLSTASVDASTALTVPQIAGLIAGEDLAIGPCYIKAADGKAYQSSGAAATEPAETDGWNVRAGVKAGQAVTLYGRGIRIGQYAAGMTPGATLFMGAAGTLDTAATTGDAVGIARSINATDIRVTRDA